MSSVNDLVYDPSSFTAREAYAILSASAMPAYKGTGAWYLEDIEVIERLRNGIPPDQSPVWRSAGVEGPAIPDAAIVTMVRNAAETIGPWLAYHHRLGFRRFVVIDHASVDGTSRVASATAQELHETELLVVRESHQDHYQRELITGGARLALSRWPVQWIVALDGDEFLATSEPIVTLSRVSGGAEQIRFAWVDQVSASATVRARQALAGGDGSGPSPWSDVFKRGMLVLVYKVALTRTALQSHAFAQGNHQADGLGSLGDCGSGLAHGLVIRHAPSLDANAHLAKAIRAVEAGYGDAGRHRVGGDQWVHLARQLTEQGERAVVESWINSMDDKLSRYRREPDSVSESMLRAMGRADVMDTQ